MNEIAQTTDKRKRLDGPFVQIPLRAIENLSHPAVFVFIALTHRMNKDGFAWPSYRDISKISKVSSRSTISKCLKELESKGWISKNRKHNTSTVYNINVNNRPDCPPNGQSDCPPNGQSLSTASDANYNHKLQGTTVSDYDLPLSGSELIHEMFRRYPAAQSVFDASWFYELSRKYLSFDVQSFIRGAAKIISTQWIGRCEAKYISPATQHNMIRFHREVMGKGESRDEMDQFYEMLSKWLSEGGKERPRTFHKLYDMSQIYEHAQLAMAWERERWRRVEDMAAGKIPFDSSQI